MSSKADRSSKASKSSKTWGMLGELAARRGRLARDPRVVTRVVLGLLLIANVAAALALFRPWSMSPEELEREVGRLQEQLRERKGEIDRLRLIVNKVEKAREDGDDFMRQYFLNERTQSSAIVSELRDAAEKARLRQEVQTFQPAPIEGSDNLSMMTITANYEGTYENLVSFLNLLDRSPRLVILDTLAAAPQRTAGTLSVNLTIHVFVSDLPEKLPESDATGTEEAAPTDVASSRGPEAGEGLVE